MNAHRQHWRLDPDVVFLNHGSFGATPTAVLEYQSELRARMEAEPVKFFVRDLMDLLEPVRDQAAAFVGCSPDDFVFVTNATTGVNTVLRSIPFQAGDEIVLTNHEYNACRNTADAIAKATGARVRVAEIGLPVQSSNAVVEAVVGVLTPRTKLVLVDHVTSQTALVFPVARIAEAVRERCDARILVDGAHAPGMLDLHVESLGVDYYTGNFHKWVCSPKSGAFLWVRPELRPELRPLVVSHGDNGRFDCDVSRFHFQFAWQGTQDPTPILAIGKAIDVMRDIGGSWHDVRSHNRQLALSARALLQNALETHPVCPDDMVGAIATIFIPDGSEAPHRTPLYLDPLQDELFTHHRIEVPIIPFPRPGRRLLRVSAQLYNDVRQYELLATALSDLL